jgi:type VI secretion system protein ImpE
MADTVADKLDAGDLDGAIEALNQEVRAHPADTRSRSRLAELLCLAGNLDRADRLLDLLQGQDPKIAVGVALFRQLIRAEQARQQFYADCRLPEFLEPPSEHDQLYLKAVVAIKDGNPAEAGKLLSAAEEARPPLPGTIDGKAFDDLRDLDDVTAMHFEVLTSTGKFFWIPMRKVESLILHKPETQRDLLWRRATMSVASGPDGEIFLPTIYPVAAGTAPGALARLGRESDFVGGDGAPMRGVGLRSFLVGDEARTILEIGRLEFPAAA